MDKKIEIIKNLLREKGIQDSRLIDAIINTPREIFYPNILTDDLYNLSNKKFYGSWGISDLEYIADIISNIDLNNVNKVLVIGSGTGYLMAILSFIFAEVYGTEIDKKTNESCMENLDKVGISNAISYYSDGLDGWENEKFDLIVVNCGLPFIPKNLLEQLNQSGTMILPIGDLTLWPDEPQNLMKVYKNEDVEKSKLISKVFVTPMFGKVENFI